MPGSPNQNYLNQLDFLKDQPIVGDTQISALDGVLNIKLNGYAALIDIRFSGFYSATIHRPRGWYIKQNTLHNRLLMLSFGYTELGENANGDFGIYRGDLKINKCFIRDVNNNMHIAKIMEDSLGLVWDGHGYHEDSPVSIDYKEDEEGTTFNAISNTKWEDAPSSPSDSFTRKEIRITGMPIAFGEFIKDWSPETNPQYKVPAIGHERLYEDRSTIAPELPSNYKLASEAVTSNSGENRCSNCSYFKNNQNYCNLWKAPAREMYYCNSHKNEVKMKIGDKSHGSK